MVDGAKEHFVQTQGVGTILLYNHVGVDHIVHRLRHLFNSPTAHIFAIFEHKLCRGIFGTPLLEGLHIEHIVVHNVHVHVYRRGIVLVLQSKAYKGVGVLYAVHKVGTALYHALVNKLLEWLVLARHAKVEEELVPETAVNQVSRSVFRTTDIQVYILPIFISLLSHERRIVGGVHIAQVVSRRTGKAWHG